MSNDILIENHRTTPLQFTKESAIEVFSAIYHHISEKLQTSGFRSITSDMRDCVEKLGEILGDPPRNGNSFSPFTN
jgi:hypothetical protein